MSRRVSILGATGSVGLATLDLIERAPQGMYQVVALTAKSNADELARLAIQHRAECVAIADESAAGQLQSALASHPDIEIGIGAAAIEAAASRPADWTMAAIVGAAGLMPTVAALRQGAHLAFANKECLVCAGDLFMREAERCGSALLPVDSEHNAVFQVFETANRANIHSVTLTASGGPFRDWTRERMASARLADALAHPTWKMGPKITIDSATMMNKGLEIIEACWLFDLPHTQVDVLVHKQSIVHGLVNYRDGSTLAQLGSPDMRTPIASTLAWPDRMAAPAKRLDLAELSKLDFKRPDPDQFPALGLARSAIEAGGNAPAIFNAANEVAVQAFLEERIGFLDIVRCVEDALDCSRGDSDMPGRMNGFDDVLIVDRRARELARELIAAVSAA